MCGSVDTQTLPLPMHLPAHLSCTIEPCQKLGDETGPSKLRLVRPMRRPQFTLQQSADHGPAMQIHSRGLQVLDDPQTNRGTAFTLRERDHLGLHGLLPPRVETIDDQVARCYEQYRDIDSDVGRWVFLTQLHDSNEVLFYRLVGDHVEEMLPIVYTPTVGTAIEEFSHLFRRPRGLFLNIDDVDGIERALKATGLGPDDVDLIVASDGEAILGIGDWGVGGVDISIGKLAVYTVAAGIDPAACSPSGSTSAPTARSCSPTRATSGCGAPACVATEYDAFIDAYVAAASRRFPNAILHWEDFSGPQARASSSATATRCAPSTTTSRARRRSAWRACCPVCASRAAG